MAIALNNTSGGLNNGGVNSITFAHTVNAGSNRILIVGVATEAQSGSGGTSQPITGITFNGVALSKIRHEHNLSGSDYVRVELWYLVNPDVTTANIVVTFTGTSISGTVAMASSYNGVDQTNPINAFNGANAGSGTDAESTTTSTVANCMFVDAVVMGSAGNTMSCDGDQTQRHNAQNAGGHVEGGMSEELVAAAGAEVMGWTLSGSTRWGHVSAALAPMADTAIRDIIGVGVVPFLR